MHASYYRMVYQARKRTCLKDITLIKKTEIFMIIFTLFALTATFAESAKGKTYALVISGISKDIQDNIARARAVSDLQKFLLDKNVVTSETIKVLTTDNTGNNPNSSQLENLQKTINNFESLINSNDRFIFYYTGQANVIGEQLRFNLPGEDMTQKQLSILLKNIKASSVLIVLDCPASGLAVKELSGKGRIIICSCTGEQRFSVKFSEYFIPALADTETDIDKDGRISILEVFIATSKHVEDWYRENQLVITETPVLDDNGDGKASKEPWRYMLDVKDGLLASEFFFLNEF